VHLGDVAGGGILAALPIPLGSLIELLVPHTLAGPAGMPLTPVVPAPAEPAFGCLLHFLMLLRQRWHRQRPCLVQRR
jgi:hypothetical protein